MITHFDEDLMPSYELTRQETQELEDIGYVEVEGLCFTLKDNQVTVYKEYDEYNEIKLNYGGRK